MLLLKSDYCPFSAPILFKESTPLYSTLKNTIRSTHNAPVSFTSTSETNVTPLNANTVLSKSQPLPSHTLFDKSVLTHELAKPINLRSVGSGLVNEGCTCYCNATLQALMYLPPFIRAFEKKLHSIQCTSQECYFCILEDLYMQMMSGTQSTIHPTAVLLRLKRIGSEFSRHRQSDANEFMIKLLERVENSLLSPYKFLNLDYPSKCTTLLHQIMGSWMQSDVACPQCKHVSTTFTMELFSSLEISNGVDCIERALQRHTRSEILGSGNEWKCDNCKKYVKASKRITFRETPMVLSLQLKRFEYKFHGMPVKLTKSVAFSEHLDIKPYLSTNIQNNKTDTLYSLQSVILHYGGVHGGHYTAYIKAPNEIWHEMNDSRVKPISLKTVLNATSDAYVLFYTRKEPSPKSSPFSLASIPSPPPSLTSSPVLRSTASAHVSSSFSITPSSKPTVKSSSIPMKPFLHPVTPSPSPYSTSPPTQSQHFVKCHPKSIKPSFSSWSNLLTPQQEFGDLQDHYNKQYLENRSIHPSSKSKRSNAWDYQCDLGKSKKKRKKYSRSWRNAFSRPSKEFGYSPNVFSKRK